MYDTQIQEWVASLECPPFKAPNKMRLVGWCNGVKVEMSYDSLRRIAKFDDGPANEYIYPSLKDLYHEPNKHPQWQNMLDYLFLPGTTHGKLYRRNLRMEAKLLFTLCLYNVVPRRGDKMEVQFQEVPILYMMMHGTPKVPFRFLVLNNIWLSKNSGERKIIPHCRLITALLKKYGAIKGDEKGSYKRFRPFDLKNLGSDWTYTESERFHKLKTDGRRWRALKVDARPLRPGVVRNVYFRCMRTRSSHKLSPLVFDPEIERTLRANRILLRENTISSSPTTPITPIRYMDRDPPPPTTGDPFPPFTPTSTQPSPNTIIPPNTTEPTIIQNVTPTNTTQPITTQEEPTITFNPSTTIPPLSHFFPGAGPSYASHTIAPSSTIVHATSFRPSNQSGFQYSTLPFGQSSGIQGDGYDEGYEEFEGYDEDGYAIGGDGEQGEYSYMQGQVQVIPNVGGVQQQLIPQHIRPRPQGPQLQRPVPLQQVRPQHLQQQFQRPIQHPPVPQQQFQQPMAPQGPMQRPMGQVRPRGRFGVPRRHLRENARGIEAQFRPVITHNPSPVVIPHNNQGRTFEVRTNSLQSLPKYKGQATEEPYFHLEAYDSICNTLGSQGFSADDVKLVLFQFSLEDKAKKWFYTLPSASIYTWAEMQQTF
ncbi:hypothetical protein Hdeb2414_s0222g00838601 [Helianthus debilis subsp. tardiflorus]